MDNLKKTTTKLKEKTEMWFKRRMLCILFMDLKEIKLNCATRTWHIIGHKYHICKLQAVFLWPCDEEKKLKHLVTTGLILKEKAAGERRERRYSMD